MRNVNAEATSTEIAAAVAAKGAPVAPNKAASKKGASRKKDACKAKKGGKATKPPDDASCIMQR
jgi:hypothetical protein